MIWIAIAAMALTAMPIQDASSPKAEPARANDPDVIAAKLTGEPDPCARRELIVSQYAAELAGRFENPTPEDLAEFRRMASEMYQASQDLARPDGEPTIDFATACPAVQTPARAQQATGSE